MTGNALKKTSSKYLDMSGNGWQGMTMAVCDKCLKFLQTNEYQNKFVATKIPFIFINDCVCLKIFDYLNILKYD